MCIRDSCSPLYKARSAKKLQWTNECQQSFDSLKKKLTPFPVLQPLIKIKTVSMHAIGAVLSQHGHPVLFVSRKLSDAETRYSNIEREVLACGHYIFDPNASIKVDISPRLMKFSLKLMQFDYTIKHVADSQSFIADGLSRVFHQKADITPHVHFSETCIDARTMSLETEQDHFLQRSAVSISKDFRHCASDA